jgi:hypothetical protein
VDASDDEFLKGSVNLFPYPTNGESGEDRILPGNSSEWVSDRVFLGGLRSSRARLRFTSRASS